LLLGGFVAKDLFYSGSIDTEQEINKLSISFRSRNNHQGYSMMQLFPQMYRDELTTSEVVKKVCFAIPMELSICLKMFLVHI
jgi:hypothetical protein